MALPNLGPSMSFSIKAPTGPNRVCISIVVAARNFWLDPTHRRPIHPEFLRLLYEEAGFDRVERLDLQPFPEAVRLPEIDPSTVPEELAELTFQINRMRDRIDEVLYGFQDFAMVGEKAKSE